MHTVLLAANECAGVGHRPGESIGNTSTMLGKWTVSLRSFTVFQVPWLTLKMTPTKRHAGNLVGGGLWLVGQVES